MTQPAADTLTPSAALEELLAWSQNLPNWQRHGLRCVAVGKLSNDDIANTLELCRLEHGLAPGKGTFSPPEESPTCTPLTEADLPISTASEVDAPVTLTSITRVTDVNLLEAEQTLTFAPTGLTAIFGENATGKSGYARILKKACQAREREGPLLPALGKLSDMKLSPRATIGFSVGDKPTSIDWVDGSFTSPDLPFIRFFDSGCARVQVRENNEVMFAPLAIDILQRHVELCKLVSEQLGAEKASVEQTIPKSIARALSTMNRDSRIAPGTAAHKMLSALPKEASDARLRALAKLSPTEAERLVQLEQLLSKDPGQTLKVKRARIQRLRDAYTHVASVEKQLSDTAVAQLRSASEGARKTNAAAHLAATELFKGLELPEVASETWRTLWEAARNYSSLAYPGRPFPVVDDAACVLCQQPLTEDAPNRLLGFEQFISGATQSAAKQAEAALSRAAAPLRSLNSAPFAKARTTLADEDEALCNLVRRYSITARLRKRHAIKCLEGERAWEDIPHLLTSPLDSITNAGNALRKEADSLEKAISGDAQARRTLAQEKTELDSRVALEALIEDAADAIHVHRTIGLINGAVRSAGTARTSKKVTSLTKSTLTNTLRTQFNSELKGLGANFTPIEFNQVGSRAGSPHFRAQLLADPTAEVARVLSEGEHTCAALAGFLAELSISTHRSGIVFDDPVTSLDHTWRRKVATRLAEEAKHRQVTVFTHDTVFLLFLLEAAKQLEQQVRCHHLTRTKKTTGIVVHDVPWIAMNVKKRIGVLKNSLQEAKAIFNQGRHDEYAQRVESLYGLLRKTWERAVEEVLLNGVVTRFGRGIETKRVSELTDITEDDYKTIESGMGVGSEFMHDEAPAITSSPPEPDDVAKSIGQLEDWVSGIRKRRK